MSAVTFASMVPEFSPFLAGCPNLTIERAARKVSIDLCQRGKVWRVELPDITLVPTTHAYVPTSPVAYAEYCDFLTGTTLIGTESRDLKWKTYDTIHRMFPAWPNNTPGTPLYATMRTPGSILLAPVPDTAGTMSLFACLRPTRTADSWDSDMYAEFHRAIFHGVLFELLAMNERSWSNPKLADAHGKEWTYLLNEATARAESGYNAGVLQVEMRPFA